MGKKFYLVTGGREDRRTFIIESETPPKMLSEGGPCQSRTPGYDTEEDLRRKNEVLDEPCKHCGGLIKANYTEYGPILRKSLNCFSCQIWEDRSREILVPGHNKVILGENFYSIGEELPPGHAGFRGFGGRKFTFEMLDGSTVVSTNVWYGGEIPPHMKHLLPDNAKSQTTS